MSELTPSEIVNELDRYIIGQELAKRAVAVAVRNRYRRLKLPKELKDEITPKNILMIGPTGVGKTEIARRLSRLVGAPFIKVEATKFTEVGYVGKDVESMVRDLVETSIRMVKSEKAANVISQTEEMAESRLVDLLMTKPMAKVTNPLSMLFGTPQDDAVSEYEEDSRDEVARSLAEGLLEDEYVEVDVSDSQPNVFESLPGLNLEEMAGIQDFISGLMPKRTRRRRMRVSEARKVLQSDEAQRLVDSDEAIAEGLARAEQNGIIFLDELDKIAGSQTGSNSDISREGVQRDLLPILEGSNVMTKYGTVSSAHILFIAAGAFHVSKPSDLIPELQGRFPIRVELTPLTQEDFVRILEEPENALTKQYRELLGVDGVDLVFTQDGISSVAESAFRVNEAHENIGARRLYTVLERLLEEVSFAAPYSSPQRVVVDSAYVEDRLHSLIQDTNLSRYIL